MEFHKLLFYNQAKKRRKKTNKQNKTKENTKKTVVKYDFKNNVL
jgi:hypothetical protein